MHNNRKTQRIIAELIWLGLLLAIAFRPAFAQQESAREYYQEGIFYVSQQKYEEAIMALEKAVAMNPFSLRRRCTSRS